MRKYIVRVGYRDFYFDDVIEAAHFVKVGIEHIEEGEEMTIRSKKEEDSLTEPCIPDSCEPSNEPLIF